ncbi:MULTISPECIES: hypothetical protein [unclassified Massilia]|uniref:hypothetical protein n=1 Tax=unclassified Massilia TaxID=2609279 RepID=UPI0012E112AF|nr:MULTISPECIES: hypothetical protein [unclassified Massilia]
MDKTALASKKVASAHLLLWICRRFSTDAAVNARILWLILLNLHLVQQKPGCRQPWCSDWPVLAVSAFVSFPVCSPGSLFPAMGSYSVLPEDKQEFLKQSRLSLCPRKFASLF